VVNSVRILHLDGSATFARLTSNVQKGNRLSDDLGLRDAPNASFRLSRSSDVLRSNVSVIETVVLRGMGLDRLSRFPMVDLEQTWRVLLLITECRS